MIYMDNAATTMMKPEEVVEAVVRAMNHMGNAGRGGNEASLSAARVIYDTREKLCHFFCGENPKQIAWTSNSTESLNIAIKGLLKPGDHVLTTVLEHNSVLRPLYEMEDRGVRLSVAGCDRKGNLDMDDLISKMKDDTRMIVCTHGSNLTGNLVPVRDIGRMARERGILFVVDASQTAGIFPIDVKAMNIDVLCFTGHKGLMGPQGTGGIYVSPGISLKGMKSGGTGVQTFRKQQPEEMPTALEAGTLNGHGISGLSAAMDYIARVGMDNIRRREQMLMERFYRGISEVEGVKIYGDFSSTERCAIVAMNIGDYDSAEVSDALLVDYDIATRSGGHCAPLMHEAFGTVEQGAVRFSFSHFNTEEEIDFAVNAVKELARE